MIIEREFSENDFLNDKSFLLKLDNERNRRVFVKITVLDRDEMPIRDIEGQITTGGNINIDGNSAMRRTASISFVAEEKDNNLDDIDNLLSMNKRIKLSIGLENNIDKRYGDIVWFKQGIFIITNPSLSHSATAVNIGLNLKDKMCLLNGQSAGTLPTSVTFDSYDQIVNGERVSMKQKFYDIIQTAVINYGGESAENVLIEDVPLQNKQIVHWAGSGILYYQPSSNVYQIEKPDKDLETWKQFEYNDEIGYVYTDFVYPKELKTTINSNISSGVLDSIISYLGNHEYYYDIDGRFRFREKRNYLNNSYDPTIDTRLDNSGREGVKIQPNGLSILDNTNYQVDFTRNDKYAYEFSENNSVVTSYSNSPDFQNIKNDFHIWGKNEDRVLHYHLVIKRKPKVDDFGTYQVYYELKGDEFTGRVRLATEAEIASGQSVRYTPKDWRAELYMQGLEAQKRQIRPDIYQQELLDLFDMIYDMKNQCFKEDIINKPNGLNYFFDYLEPSGKMQDYSVDNIGTRIHVEQKDNITKLYNMNIPNVCLIDVTDEENLKKEEIKKCLDNGNMYSQVDHEVYENIQEGAIGYSAQDAVRNLLNQYTNFNETISIQCMPIYYLEPNTRIKVDDMASNIHGDYIIKSISLPIDGKSTMSITATRIQTLA